MPLPPMPTPASLPASPNYAALAGPAAAAPPSAEGQTAGAAQMGTGLTKLGLEVDQALKLLAQMAPVTQEWVLKTTQELQQQIGRALQSQLSAVGGPDSAFPDGSSRLSGLMS